MKHNKLDCCGDCANNFMKEFDVRSGKDERNLIMCFKEVGVV
jgi:hypothetical protein